MEVNGDARVALFHATHRGYGCTYPLGQRGLGEAAPAAGQRNVVAELAQGALGRQGQGVFHKHSTRSAKTSDSFHLEHYNRPGGRELTKSVKLSCCCCSNRKNVRIGQPIRVTVDALGGQSYAGRVAEISPATTSEFSIIKADSGTGNFVKIAQRMAVKVTLDPDQQELRRLAPGISVEVRVDTKQKGHGR